MTTADKIKQVYKAHQELVLEKNKRYGNSALEPIGIFNKADASNSIKIRLDDKLQRIKNSSELSKNDVSDMMGYLILLCVYNEWNDFKEQID
jgi:hypothetical protein